MRELRVATILLVLCVGVLYALTVLGVQEEIRGLVLMGFIGAGFPILRQLDYWITER